MKHFIGYVILWFAASGFAGDVAFTNFDPAVTRKTHCEIVEQENAFHLHVYGYDANDSEVYRFAYSVRQERMKSMKDCDRWMKGARKLILDYQKSHTKRRP